MLDGETPKIDTQNAKLVEFVDLYTQMVSGAWPEVSDILKQLDTEYRAEIGYTNRGWRRSGRSMNGFNGFGTSA